jgi:hypothetical protein
VLAAGRSQRTTQIGLNSAQILLVALLAGASLPAHSASRPVDSLATHATWLKLGHYEHSGSSPSGWRSAVHPGDFFLSPDGATDPRAELAATLAAFQAPPPGDPDQNARCRYPARLSWLRKQLGANANFGPDIHCPAFDAWTQSGSVASISVIFASGFLGNPASYYGHTLLKFNFRGGATHTGLLDESVSYGAILDGRHDGPVTYVARSLTGRYDAGFSHIRFYYHDHNYGNEELRDLWEYRLDLPQDDVDFVVAHAWEVLGKRYTYYFFRGNCAYQMAEVLEIIDGLSIIPPDRPWTIPQSMMQQLTHTNFRGQPLVAAIVYHPSRQSRYYERFRSLSPADARLMRALVEKQVSFGDAEFEQRSIASQQAVVNAMLDYYQFVNSPLAEAPVQAQRDYAAALAERYRLPAGEPDIHRGDPESPDRARPPGWTQLAAGHNSAIGDGVSIRVRPAYYDALDFDSGHVRYGSLSMGDTQIDLLHDRVRLNKLDVIRIESVNPGISSLPGDRGASWKLGLGATQARLWCEQCLVARADVDLGYGRQPVRNLFGAVYLGAALQSERADQGWGFARATAVVIGTLRDSLRYRLLYEYRLPAGGATGSYAVAQAELRWSPSRRTDVRLRLDYDHAHSVGLGAGFYW